jgi:hypothetical protein
MTTTVLHSGPDHRSMRGASARFHSPRGALGALVLLLALPITIVYSMFFPVGAEAVIHFALAVGTFLIASSVFDFDTPSWLQWVACVAGSALGLIFLGQGLAELTQNDALRNFAFSRELGGWGEMLAISLVMTWFVAVALTQGRGPTMVLGVLSSALAVALGVWSIVWGGSAGTPQELRLLFLLPIAWFLFVSARRPYVRSSGKPRKAAAHLDAPIA